MLPLVRARPHSRGAIVPQLPVAVPRHSVHKPVHGSVHSAWSPSPFRRIVAPSKSRRRSRCSETSETSPPDGHCRERSGEPGAAWVWRQTELRPPVRGDAVRPASGRTPRGARGAAGRLMAGVLGLALGSQALPNTIPSASACAPDRCGGSPASAVSFIQATMCTRGRIRGAATPVERSMCAVVSRPSFRLCVGTLTPHITRLGLCRRHQWCEEPMVVRWRISAPTPAHPGQLRGCPLTRSSR